MVFPIEISTSICDIEEDRQIFRTSFQRVLNYSIIRAGHRIEFNQLLDSYPIELLSENTGRKVTFFLNDYLVNSRVLRYLGSGDLKNWKIMIHNDEYKAPSNEETLLEEGRAIEVEDEIKPFI